MARLLLRELSAQSGTLSGPAFVLGDTARSP